MDHPRPLTLVLFLALLPTACGREPAAGPSRHATPASAVVIVVEPPPAAPPVTPAPPVRPAVLPRSAWGAGPLARLEALGPLQAITLHHTGMPTHRHRSGPELLAGIERVHMMTNGWSAIGYHLVIAGDGSVWEGRPADRRGAHAGGEANHGNLGIAIAGDCDLLPPTEAQLATLDSLLTALLSEHDLEREAVRGHHDFRETACPGHYLADWLTTWRSPTTVASRSELALP